MELNYLNDFVTLARIRHFQNAADALFISQSTLSKHIKAIESELGQDLFIRSRKCSQLTEFGRLFLPYAKKILEIQQEYTALLLPRPAADAYVSFGSIPMVTLYNFMRFFTLFLKRSPAYQYNMIQGSTQRLLTLLKQKQVEFILTVDIPDLPEEEYERVLYARDRLVAILPPNHRLASSKYVTVEDLEKENLIAFSSMNAEGPLRQMYPNSNFRITISVEKEALLYELVRHGYGISIMTYWSSQKVSGEGIVVKDIYPLSNIEFYMIYPKKGQLSALTKSFADYLKARNDKGLPES